MTWHVLDVGSIWIKEFASELARFVPTVNWSPVMRNAGAFENWEREEHAVSPALRVRHFPLQRGYSRFPFSLLENLGRRQSKRMLRFGDDPGHSPLICTTPYYASVAERWKGPVIYYQTDLTYAYHGLNPEQVRALDTRLCRVAITVCPNSRRIAHYMVDKAGCEPSKIVVVPNGTRAENVLPKPPSGPGLAPTDLADLPRPLIGVLGNLAANLDWCLLLEAVERTPDYSWAFIGPYSMEIYDAPQREARERLLKRTGRIRFLGLRPYEQLQGYARALDLAVLPYKRKEPTFSGSSTRFYEHLAACRPMLATHGFEELTHMEPLLRLVKDADELVGGLEEIRASHFEDGWEAARWEASQKGTWTMRAATLIQAARNRWPGTLEAKPLPAGALDMHEQGRYECEESLSFALVDPS